jgi:hypothetical protein
VTPERAKEMGVSFKIHKNGEAGYAVTMEFEDKGALKDVTYVRLQIGEGEKRVMSSQLRITHPEQGKSSARFSAFPAYLKDSYFMIVSYSGSRGGVGYRFKVEDFVELPPIEE